MVCRRFSRSTPMSLSDGGADEDDEEEEEDGGGSGNDSGGDDDGGDDDDEGGGDDDDGGAALSMSVAAGIPFSIACCAVGCCICESLSSSPLTLSSTDCCICVSLSSLTLPLSSTGCCICGSLSSLSTPSSTDCCTVGCCTIGSATTALLSLFPSAAAIVLVVSFVSSTRPVVTVTSAAPRSGASPGPETIGSSPCSCATRPGLSSLCAACPGSSPCPCAKTPGSVLSSLCATALLCHSRASSKSGRAASKRLRCARHPANAVRASRVSSLVLWSLWLWTVVGLANARRPARHSVSSGSASACRPALSIREPRQKSVFRVWGWPRPRRWVRRCEAVGKGRAGQGEHRR